MNRRIIPACTAAFAIAIMAAFAGLADRGAGKASPAPTVPPAGIYHVTSSDVVLIRNATLGPRRMVVPRKFDADGHVIIPVIPPRQSRERGVVGSEGAQWSVPPRTRIVFSALLKTAAIQIKAPCAPLPYDIHGIITITLQDGISERPVWSEQVWSGRWKRLKQEIVVPENHPGEPLAGAVQDPRIVVTLHNASLSLACPGKRTTRVSAAAELAPDFKVVTRAPARAQAMTAHRHLQYPTDRKDSSPNG